MRFPHDRMKRMRCRKCLLPIEQDAKFCPRCGEKQRKIHLAIVVFIAVISIAFGSFLTFKTAQNLIPLAYEFFNEHQAAFHEEVPENDIHKQSTGEFIKKAQKTVYTIYTEYNQGSGFLYDEAGYVVTNAHVVEGSLNPIVKTYNGIEYEGRLVGYSNEIDVALIYVPQLKGTEPFPQEKERNSEVGIEVAALGTPLGQENTATFGYLTGVNRTFHLPPHQFNNVYQISAPIEPGNSGGPLLSLEDGKIIAINAAKRMDVDHIAFSIPLKQVVPLVDEWLHHPMSKTEISSLFYTEDGHFYYDHFWSIIEDHFFDDGYYLDDEHYHHYWYDEEHWDSYDDSYDDWHDEDYDEYWDKDYDRDIDHDWDSEYDRDVEYDEDAEYDWDVEYNWDNSYDQDEEYDWNDAYDWHENDW